MEPNISNQEPPKPRPTPRARSINVTVVRDPITGNLRLNLEPPTVDLRENEQVAWRSNDGRLEIRFSPNITPFVGATYKTARGGTIFSGAPARDKVSRTPYPYTLLLTNPAGFFIKQDADLRVVDQNTPPRDPPKEHEEGLICRFIHWLERVFC